MGYRRLLDAQPRSRWARVLFQVVRVVGMGIAIGLLLIGAALFALHIR